MTDSTTEQMAGVLLDEFVRQYCTKLEQLNYGPSDDQCLPAVDHATSPTHGRTRRCLRRAHAGHRGGTGARRGLARRPTPYVLFIVRRFVAYLATLGVAMQAPFWGLPFSISHRAGLVLTILIPASFFRIRLFAAL
jgi:hypothetical protein